MIDLQNISFDHHKTPIFKELSLKIGKGETWAIVGPSGCGKTTLLSLVCGLLKPKAGQVMIDGMLLIKPRKQTGLILQDYGLLPWATIRDNILLGKKLQQFGLSTLFESNQRFETPEYDGWITKLGLCDLQEKYPHQLSGGQKQRAAIARTFILNPDLILLDEPFSALDGPTREALIEEIRSYISEQHTTLLMVTHSIDEAFVLCDHFLVILDAPNNSFETIHLESGTDRAETIERVKHLMRNSMDNEDK